ncbi:MarR family transcriptional regulator [Jiella sp. MQZ9-1]|nr:MarR family transcriptional regulator [Jiella flava]MCD2470415.1 MarR family transcriptional regulator [Jiella flava]
MLSKSPPVIVPSLLSIAKSTRAFLTILLAEIDLHPGQDQLIDRLEIENPVNVSALADLLAVRPSTVSKMLDRLIERGLVSRSSNARDARRTMVHLTPQGLETQQKIREVWSKLEADLTAALSSEEIALLDTSLDRAEDILIQRLRRLR